MLGKTAKILVKLYAAKDADQIDARDLVLAFNVSSYDKVKAQAGFDEAYNRVREAKEELEALKSNYDDHEQQALFCLAKLHESRREQRIRPAGFWEMEALIRQYLYPTWGSIQQEYDVRCKVLTHWFDAFISYTNRDATNTNNSYIKLISGLPRDIRLSRTNPKNCMAHIVARIIQVNNLACFRDFEKLECGDDIEEKIREHAASSFAFVQLLEPEVFAQPDPPKINWCHEEFIEFERACLPNEHEMEDLTRYFGILLRGECFSDVAPLVKSPYKDWIDKAESIHTVIANEYQNKLDEFSKAVKRIAANIIQSRNNIIETMLSGW